jgi:hypothetical protein
MRAQVTAGGVQETEYLPTPPAAPGRDAQSLGDRSERCNQILNGRWTLSGSTVRAFSRAVAVFRALFRARRMARRPSAVATHRLARSASDIAPIGRPYHAGAPLPGFVVANGGEPCPFNELWIGLPNPCPERKKHYPALDSAHDRC